MSNIIKALPLDRFEKLNFDHITVRDLNGGKQAVIFFPNGYGASVINHSFSYGTELAILKGDKEKYDLCYDTPITDDVIGHIGSADKLISLLTDISKLEL